MPEDLNMGSTDGTMTSFVDIKDDTPLVGVREKSRKRNCILLSLSGLLLLTTFIIAGYVMYWKDVVGLKVMALNTWGMPASLGASDKEERMAAIGRRLAMEEYDIIMLEELWMRPDHATINKSLPSSYRMTSYNELSSGSCEGTLTPLWCSGLAVVSRYPMEEIEFTQYTQQGSFVKALTDGEKFSGKGVGRVRIRPKEGVTVDIMVTHTIAEDGNAAIREQQVEELVEKHIKPSKADFVILGGDFNASPDSKIEQTYHKIRAEMTNSIEEILVSLKSWINPEYATYGNKKNTYTGDGSIVPVIYDYIFHKQTTTDPAMIWTNWFHLPFLKAKIKDNSTVSLSDHEAVTSHIYLWKQQ